MKSSSFSRCKKLRCKTKSFQKSIKQIKTSRIRKDRRYTRMILKSKSEDELKQTILVNNGNLEIC